MFSQLPPVEAHINRKSAYCFNRRLVLVAVAIQQRLKAPTEDSKGDGNFSTKQAENTWMEKEDWNKQVRENHMQNT